MKKNLNLLVALTIVVFLFSCSSDSADDLDPSNPPNGPVTYTDNVKSIIDGRCISCHANPPVNGAPVSLKTYSEVEEETKNGSLLNRIERTQGTAGVMPPSGNTLSTAQIQTINDWIDDGYLE